MPAESFVNRESDQVGYRGNGKIITNSSTVILGSDSDDDFIEKLSQVNEKIDELEGNDFRANFSANDRRAEVAALEYENGRLMSPTPEPEIMDKIRRKAGLFDKSEGGENVEQGASV